MYIQVSSQNKHGTLLEVVQELTGMELTISKAYITCDGGWFIDGELPLLFLNHYVADRDQHSKPFEDPHPTFPVLMHYFLRSFPCDGRTGTEDLR